jgi:N-succinyldiaminopimelate aminotransferase
MNPRLDTLQPYPFEKLRALLAQSNPAASGLRPINLSIGEPKHPAPDCVKTAIVNGLDGLSVYPPTKGDPKLRQAISAWIGRRYGIPCPDPETQILPALGSREALFAFGQVVLDDTKEGLVVCPNPFYQIYEGAALLGGATPFYVNSDPENNFRCDWSTVPSEVWARTQLLFVCSPGNPAGNVMPLSDWKILFDLSDKYNFVIASDECYSEIFLDENNPPLGGMQAAFQLGRTDFRNLMSFSSLSKRSNVPGMRSGFVAGDAKLIAKFLLYRTYHGSALSPVVSTASIAAWNDEAHVIDNRAQYRAKFDAVLPILKPVLDVERPDASFYLWAGTPGPDAEFVRDLLTHTNVTLLPGSYVGRTVDGINPGLNRIRIALVAPLADCVEGAQRIADFVRSHYSQTMRRSTMTD